MSFSINPELRGVLEDIGASGKSAIFAGSFFTKVHQVYTLPEGRFTTFRAGLSLADRQLLTVHRADLARLLREAFLAGFYSSEERKAVAEPDRDVSLADDWAERVAFTRDSAQEQAFKPGVAPWLRRLLEGRMPSTMEDFRSLLSVSLKLDDHPMAQLYLGLIDLTEQDSQAVYRRVGDLALAGPPSVQIGAMTYVRSALCLEGRWDEADRLAWSTVDLALRHDLLQPAAIEVGGLVYREYRREMILRKSLIARAEGLVGSSFVPEALDVIQQTQVLGRPDPAFNSRYRYDLQALCGR